MHSKDFGLKVGLAFQLQDDLLNLVGNAQVQGKDFRSDITEGKRTLPWSTRLSTLARRKRQSLSPYFLRIQAILEASARCGAYGKR